MEIRLIILACFLAAGFLDVDARLTGKEREDIKITCSHSNAYGNIKYFCRGQCSYDDVLITSRGPNTEKYHIVDNGNVFFVTIKKLELKDAGLYWCGVDRAGVDTYNRVNLNVELNPEEVKEVTDMPRGIEDTDRSSETVAYIGVGLGISFVLLVLVLLFFFLQRRRHSAERNGKPDHCSINSPDQEPVVYSDVTLKRNVQDPADNTLYSNVTSTQSTNSEAPVSEQVTYSAIRIADAVSV